jgi:surface polysaccharide O-acyltransferase-like enzyme
MNSKKQYNSAVDVLRILSILAVVGIHTTTRTLEVSLFALQKIPFTLFLNQIFRFAVPLFFIISGFVLELSFHTNENYLIYLKKRLSRIFIPYVFWSVIYYFLVYSKNRNPNFLFTLLRGDASYQLYFIPTLLIFYLIFPFIHKYIKIIGNIWVIFFLFLIQLFLLFRDYNGQHIQIFYPLAIFLLNYFPFIFGVFISRNFDMFKKFINKWKLILFLGTIISGYFVFYEGFVGYLTTHNYLTFYSQWKPSVLIYTMFIGGTFYYLFDRNIFNSFVLKTISKLSFFVFFVHVIILEGMWYLIGIKIFQLQFAQNLWWDPIYFSAVTLISFFIAYIAHKIPYLSKLTG